MSASARFRARVVVDMTPLEPRGRNGGAGLVATSLVRELRILAPEIELILLTSPDSHAELAWLDAENVRRMPIDPPRAPAAGRGVLDRVPSRLRTPLKAAYRSLRATRQARRGRELDADLLLCPFTEPTFWRAGVPCISVVHDLQYVTYPQFFSVEQRQSRQRHVHEACARATYVVCVSEYVRGSVLAAFDVSSERVVTVPLGVLQPPVEPDPAAPGRYGVAVDTYLLYPANFWPHKNHRMLFEAMKKVLDARPERPLRLVCTGAPNALMQELDDVAAALLPPGAVVFPGYVTPAELAGLLDGARALIFPSLYEGFGMPVVEAMARGKPVLCSNVTSLPEVAGDAAILFDPTSPSAIALSIDALDSRTELIALGLRRAAELGTAHEMAGRYLTLIRNALAARTRSTA